MADMDIRGPASTDFLQWECRLSDKYKLTVLLVSCPETRGCTRTRGQEPIREPSEGDSFLPQLFLDSGNFIGRPVETMLARAASISLRSGVPRMERAGFSSGIKLLNERAKAEEDYYFTKQDGTISYQAIYLHSLCRETY
jgi:hypothetical protein